MTLLHTAAVLACAATALGDPTIDFRPFTSGPYAAEVGHLNVPENRANPASRSLRLAVLRLRSTATEPGPPLIVLPGGPGNSATALGASPLWTPLLELGDVVLMDPRGVNRSEPDLYWTSESMHPERFFGDEASAHEHMRAMCAQAAAHHRAAGIDLGGYHTVALADDIDALRRALGAETVHLLGHSYGTHLGLTILARHPDTVARFVSVGTAGPGDMMKLPADLDRSLDVLSAAIAADPDVGPSMPDFAAAVRRAIASVEAQPLPVPVVDPRTGAEREVLLGAHGLRLLLLADLGDTSDLPVFPRLVHSIERRDPSLVRWFLTKRMQQFERLPVYMFTVRAASGATAERWSRIRREADASPFGTARCLFSPTIDAALGVHDLGDAFRAPVRSDVPILFISGTLDAHTPPFQAERVRSGFARSGHVVVINGGHEDLLPDHAVQARIRAFLAGAAPRDERLERPPLRFVPIDGLAPAGVHPALR